MDTQSRFSRLLMAPPELLAKIDALLEGRVTEPQLSDRRLLTFSQAADTLGVSRQTIWRMAKENRIPTVEIRPGTRRVPSYALSNLVRNPAH